MLTAEPKDLLGKTYRIVEEDVVVAVVRQSIWKEKAEIELGGRHYRFERDRALRGSFLLLEQDNVLAYANKPSAFRQRFELRIEGRDYLLRKPSVWRRGFCVEDSSGELGTIRPVGILSRKASIELPESWTLIVRIFIFWLVLLIWQRERAAAASS